jgi:hypothetical protein
MEQFLRMMAAEFHNVKKATLALEERIMYKDSFHIFFNLFL